MSPVTAREPETRWVDREIMALVGRCAHGTPIRLRRGDWAPVPRTGGLGLLLVDGVVVRRVGVGGGRFCEIIGSGDVVRPWEVDEGEASLALRTRWSVLEPAVLVELAPRDTSAAAAALLEALFPRALGRAERLAVQTAIAAQVGVDRRLASMLRHLADRWGRVRGDGIVIPIRLSHTILAELVCARRPTVTTALARLARASVAQRLPDGTWLLRNPGTSGGEY